MPVSFSAIPANWRVPLYWAEVDSSMAGLPVFRQAALLAGIMTQDGDADPDVPIPISSQSQADARFGQGSEMSRMFKTFFRNNFANEVWGVGCKEPLNGRKATGVINVAQPATEGGTIHLYVGVDHVPVNIGGTWSEDEIAQAIADAINANGALPVEAIGPDDAGAPLNLTTPTAMGAPEVGVQLTMTDGTWTGSPTSFTRAWLRDGTAIPGATAANYTLDDPDEDAMISARVVATNAGGDSAPAISTAIGPVTQPIIAAPTNIAPPQVDEVSQGQQPARRRNGRAAAAGEVTIVCKWAGVSGNDIRLTLNYYNRRGGQTTPLGLVLDMPANNGHLTGGVGVPDFSDAIENTCETNFEYVGMPYTDPASLRAWEIEYGFSDDGRWGWMRQLYGHVFSAMRGDVRDLLDFSERRNSPVMSVLGFEDLSPSPAFEWTAAYCAKAQRALTNDPAAPLQTLVLRGILMAPENARFRKNEINTLAHHGIATQIEGPEDEPMISRETTTYQVNLYGFEDDAYELVTTLATLARILRNQRQAITSKFPRHKLANDGTRFGPGQKIVTPGVIKGELIAQYRQDEFEGLVENMRAFKTHLIVERDPNNQNRVNVVYPPDLINQLRLFAVLAQFRLQFDRGLDTELAIAA
jgi:phage tail sheath gpL-like